MRGLSKKKILVLFILAKAVWICVLSGLKVQKMMCDNVYLLSFKQENMFFSSSDILNIEKEKIDLSYAQHIDLNVSNGFRREDIPVFVTNENYEFFTNATMRSGAFFNSKQVSRKLPVIVINEAAAYQLFGNWECVGETVFLNEVPYKVIGIIAEENTEGAGIYIPYSIEPLKNMDIKINQIWCSFSNLADAALVMKKSGYALEEFHVLQLDLVKNVFRQRLLFLFILPGICAMIHVCKFMIRKAEEMKRDGILNRKYMAVGILQIIGAVTGFCVIWELAEIAWCAPPGYELLGESWKNVFYGLLNFYLLTDVEIYNMPYFAHWNLLSILSMLLYLFFFPESLMRAKKEPAFHRTSVRFAFQE